MCLWVCHNACHGQRSGIGWPQLSRSHRRRFHQRSVPHYSATLASSHGSSPPPPVRSHRHLRTHMYTPSHARVCFLKIMPQIHTFSRGGPRHSSETICSDAHLQTVVSHLDVQVLIDSSWQSLSAGKEV